MFVYILFVIAIVVVLMPVVALVVWALEERQAAQAIRANHIRRDAGIEYQWEYYAD